MHRKQQSQLIGFSTIMCVYLSIHTNNILFINLVISVKKKSLSGRVRLRGRKLRISNYFNCQGVERMKRSALGTSSTMILPESPTNTLDVFIVTRTMRDPKSTSYKGNFTAHVLYSPFPLYSMIKVNNILFSPSTRFLDSSALWLIDVFHISRSLIPTVPH